MPVLFTNDDYMDKKRYNAIITKTYLTPEEAILYNDDNFISDNEIKYPTIILRSIISPNVFCLKIYSFTDPYGFALFKKENSSFINKINIYNDR